MYSSMNNNVKDKSVIRRFLDNLHTREEGLSIYDKIRHPGSENIFQDVSKEVWDEAMLSQSVTDLNYLRYEEEARALLNKIEPAHRVHRIKKVPMFKIGKDG